MASPTRRPGQGDPERPEEPRTSIEGGAAPSTPRLGSFKEEETPFDEDLDLLIQVDLSTLDKNLLKPPHVKLGILKGQNYHIWAQNHRRFLEGRGMWGIVSGSLPRPQTRAEARNWMILDQWIATLLARDTEDSQQGHIASLRRSRSIWNELRRVHGVSGKGRLCTMLQRFYGYAKGSDESIDQMTTALRQ